MEVSLYCVVEFSEEKTIDVVPASWISGDRCKYPKNIGPKVAKLKRSAASVPSEKWPSYKIDVLYSNSNYSKCWDKATILEYNSNAESTAEGSAVRKSHNIRTKPKPRVLFSPTGSGRKKSKRGNRFTKQVIESDSSDLSEDSGKDDQINTDQLPPLFTVNETLNLDSDSSIASDSPADVEVSHTNNKPLEPMVESGSRSSPDSSNDEFLGNSTVQKGFNSDEFGRFYREFQRFEKTVLQALHTLKSDLDIVRSEIVRGKRGNLIDCPIEVPIRSEEWLREAEGKLKDKILADKFTRWCRSIGGTDYKNHPRRILERSIAHEMSLGLNFQGKGSKIGFQKLRLCGIICDAVVNSQDCTFSEAENVFKTWFKCAKDRNGGRARRAN